MIRGWQKIKLVPAISCVRMGKYAMERRLAKRDRIIMLLHLNSKTYKRIKKARNIKYFPKKIKSKYIRELRRILMLTKEELCHLI